MASNVIGKCLKASIFSALSWSSVCGAHAECLNPPVGSNLARGCYAQTSLWSGKNASINLWEPHKSWRGDWQKGDEGKDSAVLVFSKEGQSNLITQWCKETCFISGNEALKLFHFQLDERLIVWLIDPPRSSREGWVGDVISVDLKTGEPVLLAKDQRLLEKETGGISKEVKKLGSCRYWIPDAWFAATPAKDKVAGGYVVLSHPQPIALDTSCTDYLVHDQTKVTDIERVIKVLGEGRMRQANQRLTYGEWFLKAGNLHWVNDSGAVEKLD
jgi:hypothetical protein